MWSTTATVMMCPGNDAGIRRRPHYRWQRLRVPHRPARQRASGSVGPRSQKKSESARYAGALSMSLTGQLARQPRRRRGRVKAESPETLQPSTVADLGARGPNQDKRRVRPNPQDVGGSSSLAEDGGEDATNVYGKITDEDGREYTLFICSDRECMARAANTEFEST